MNEKDFKMYFLAVSIFAISAVVYGIIGFYTSIQADRNMQTDQWQQEIRRQNDVSLSLSIMNCDQIEQYRKQTMYPNQPDDYSVQHCPQYWMHYKVNYTKLIINGSPMVNETNNMDTKCSQSRSQFWLDPKQKMFECNGVITVKNGIATYHFPNGTGYAVDYGKWNFTMDANSTITMCKHLYTMMNDSNLTGICK